MIINHLNRRTIDLFFDEFVYDAPHRWYIQFEKGIYAAFSSIVKPDGVVLQKLLYIGKSEDSIAGRIADHEKNDYREWKKSLLPGEEIFYRVAKLEHDIEDVEAAMIYTHQPIYNTDHKKGYGRNNNAPTVVHDLSEISVNGYLIDFWTKLDKPYKPAFPNLYKLFRK